MRGSSSPWQDVRAGGGMQMLPSNASPAASGKWVQRFWPPTAGSMGDSSRRKSYSHGPHMPPWPSWVHACISGHRNLPSCPGWGGLPPAPTFLFKNCYPTTPSPLSLPFLALVCRDWEIPLLQQTPEDRAWQKNPLCNPVYLLLPPCTEFNQTPWGFTHFQLQILS